MPSPFPGMDPFVERPGNWRNFHGRYVAALAAAVMAGLPDGYVVKIDEDVYLHELSAEERRLVGRPDALVSAATLTAVGAAGPAVGAATIAAPAAATLVPAVRVERSPYLEVVDLADDSVVTVVELLSPSNKATGGDRTTYLAKRQRWQAGPAHLIEVDLLRGGPRLPLDGLPACDYYVLLSRVEERPQVGVWPIGLRDPLPTVPVPLRDGRPDVAVDLQAVFARVYDEAGFARFIYAADPRPPLSPADAAWAAERVATLAAG